MYLCAQNHDLKRGGTFETAKAGTFHSVTAGTSIPLFTSNMVSFYSNGHIDWNYRHHVAIMGEYSDSGDSLMESIKQKFPDYSEVAEELMLFQKYRSLNGLTLSDSKFIQMAKEMQQAK